MGPTSTQKVNLWWLSSTARPRRASTWSKRCYPVSVPSTSTSRRKHTTGSLQTPKPSHTPPSSAWAQHGRPTTNSRGKLTGMSAASKTSRSTSLSGSTRTNGTSTPVSPSWTLQPRSRSGSTPSPWPSFSSWCSVDIVKRCRNGSRRLERRSSKEIVEIMNCCWGTRCWIDFRWGKYRSKNGHPTITWVCWPWSIVGGNWALFLMITWSVPLQ